MKFKIIFSIYLILNIRISFSQGSSKTIDISENIVKPSSSGFSYIPAGSSLFTGMATYSIPIFELKSRDLSLPITLNYASSGIRVNEISGETGYGWNLNYGGVIQRELNGFPDEMPVKGYLSHFDEINGFDEKSLEEKKNLIVKAQNNDFDCEPDVFHFSGPGLSGEIYLTNYGLVYNITPYQYLKIDNTIEDGKIKGFEIITSDGVRYIFGIDANCIEETKVSTLSASLDYIYDSGDNSFKPILNFSELQEKKLIDDFYTSKWYLYKIISPTGDEITFEYDDKGTIQRVESPQMLKYEIQTHTAPTQYHDLIFNYTWTQDALYRRVSYIEQYDEYICREYVGGNWDYNTTICGPKHGTLYEKYDFEYGHIKYYYDPTFIVNKPASYFIHQNFIEEKIKRINRIVTSTGNMVQFNKTLREDLPGDYKIDGLILKNYKGEFINEVKFNYDLIVSETIEPTGVKTDPFSIFEAEAFRNVSLSKISGNAVPASRAISAMTNVNVPNKMLVEKYIFRGLEHYNYKRYFLKSLYFKNGNNILPPYEFTYNSPEKIQRRTTVWTDKFGYSIDSKPQNSFLNNNYNNNFQIGDDLYKEVIGTSYGQLTEIKLPTGGNIEYLYHNPTPVRRVNKIITSNEDNFPVDIKRFVYGSINYISALYSVELPYYDVKNLRIFKYFLKSSYPLFNYKLRHGSIIWHNDVTVYNDANLEATEHNGYEIYTFNSYTDYAPLTLNNYMYIYPEIASYNIEGLAIEGPWAHSDDRCDCNNTVNFTSADFIKKTSNVFPYMDEINHNIYCGNVKKLEIYNGDNELIKQTENSYEMSNIDAIHGLKGFRYHFLVTHRMFCTVYTLGECWAVTTEDKPYDQYRGAFSSYIYGSHRLYQTIEKLYPNDNNNKIETTTTYSYNIYGQVNTITQSDLSDGTARIQKIKYPKDYTNESWLPANTVNEMGNAILMMNRKNIVNIPVENIILKNGKVVGAGITTFGNKYNINITNTTDFEELVAATQVLPTHAYSLRSSIPLTHGNEFIESWSDIVFKRTSPIPITGNFYMDNNNYALKTIYDTHDKYNNLLQSHDNNNLNISTIWGYNHTIPVIKAENIDYENLIIAVIAALDNSGFSNGMDDLDNFLNSLYDMKNPADKTKLRAFVSHLKSNSLLVNSIISFYTYKPLVGMTSNTDVNGLTTYYEYDYLHRLKRILNNDGNIAEQYDYHIKPFINFSNPTLNIGYPATKQVEIISNTNWSITNKPSWVTSVYPMTSPDSKTNVTITCSQYTDLYTPRTGSITIEGSGISESLNIVQTGSYYITVEPTTDIIFDLQASSNKTETVTLNSNTTWGIAIFHLNGIEFMSTNQIDWIRVTPEVGEAVSNKSIIIEVYNTTEFPGGTVPNNEWKARVDFIDLNGVAETVSINVSMLVDNY